MCNREFYSIQRYYLHFMDIVTREMIERFLKNKSDANEAEIVAAYLKANPDAWMAQKMDEKDWQEAATKHLPLEKRRQLWLKVKSDMVEKTSKGRSYVLAAAAIIITLIGAYFLLQKMSETAYPDANQKITATNILSSNHKVIVNNTASPKQFELPDGSVITLNPNSQVEFDSSFKTERSLQLKGSGYFKVARDTRHPFTVFCDSIGTTALGTEFWVLEEASDKVTIKLTKGRVIVRPHKVGLKNVYLDPGDQVEMHRNSLLAIVTRRKTEKTKNKDKVTLQGAAPKGVATWTNASYTFNKSSLSLVFKKLESQYNVKINYNLKEINTMQFTGKIMYSDPLDVILKTICNINHLEYQRTGDRIDIKKK